VDSLSLPFVLQVIGLEEGWAVESDLSLPFSSYFSNSASVKAVTICIAIPYLMLPL
jgi:hypothetical protein